MTKPERFLIDQLVGIVPGSGMDQSLTARRALREDLQQGHDRLLAPATPGPVSLFERRAIAAFVAALGGDAASSAHFQGLLQGADPSRGRVSNVIVAQAKAASNIGPYGRPLVGPVRAADLDGPVFRASADLREVLGDKLAAALELAHLLALHPSDASEADGAKLKKAGWSDDGLRTLAELVSFVGLYLRVVAGLLAVIAAKQEPACLPGAQTSSPKLVLVPATPSGQPG